MRQSRLMVKKIQFGYDDASRYMNCTPKSIKNLFEKENLKYLNDNAEVSGGDLQKN